MRVRSWSFVVGTLMLIAGLVMFLAFHDVVTPVVGLRQIGLVLAVVGAIELVATGWSRVRSTRGHG